MGSHALLFDVVRITMDAAQITHMKPSMASGYRRVPERHFLRPQFCADFSTRLQGTEPRAAASGFPRPCIFLILALTVLPAFAQFDLSGTWSARNYMDASSNRPGPGPSPVDYIGIPLNDAARARALSYSPSQVSMPDRVCTPYTPTYIMLGPFGLKIWNETEPRNGTTVAWRLGAWEDMASITIWMDGRPHPSKYAPHEDSGFTTGVWEDDVLKTYTTHMKAGFARRNGVPFSDQATMTMRFFRHGDILTLVTRIDDPLYLTEPYYSTRTFQLAITPPMRTTAQPCVQGNEGVPPGVVPHYLPGTNPFLDELTKTYNLPLETVMGGAGTMYPDHRRKLKDKYVRPERCARYCGGPGEFPLRSD
jgi:hypothetical protein